jgi:hypothetical protein
MPPKMGWWEIDGGVVGDEAVDALGGARALKDLDDATALSAFADALGYASQEVPLYAETSAVDAVMLGRGVIDRHSDPSATHSAYDTLRDIAAAYKERWDRQPTILELQWILSGLPGVLRESTQRLTLQIVLGTERKPKRVALPTPLHLERPVFHPEFGVGVLLEESGENARVRFHDGEVRVIRRAFLKRPE